MNDMKAEVIEVTPELAAYWLSEFNYDNRSITKATVERYRDDILAGEWKLTGESIIFAGNGRLLDGQHRLLAVVEAGKSIYSLVVNGTEDSAFKVIGQPHPRTLTQIFTLDHIPNANRVSAACRAFIELGRMPPGFGRKISASKARQVLEAHPELPMLLETFEQPFPAADAVVLAMALRFYAIDVDDCFTFLKQLDAEPGCSIAPKENSPVAVLRKTLRERSKNGMTSGGKNRLFVAATTALAWNQFRKGKTRINMYTWEHEPHKFPALV